MHKFRTLVKAVCGFKTTTTIDGRPVPQSVKGLRPVAVAHDRRLSAGIFQIPTRRKNAAARYRIVVWRTYRDTTARTERAATSLYRDEIDPALRLLAQCGDRLAKGE